MEEAPLHTGRRTRDWNLNATAFHRLLNWLDEGDSSSGQSYLELRQRLVNYFDRKDCPAPEDLADETLNRVARRLEEEGAIESDTPARYCYITARYVFMENLRERRNYRLLSDLAPEATTQHDSTVLEDEKGVREKMLECLERCTRSLSSSNRDLILSYYIGKQHVKIENRRAMAQRLGISINALSIRACRIRERLATCVRQCLATG